MSINFDLNRRLDPILNNTAAIAQVDIRRIADIALPFLNLHAGAGQIAAAALSIHRIVVIFNQDAPVSNHAWELAQIVGSITLSIFLPAIYYLLSQGLCLATHLWQLGHHLMHQEGASAVKELFLIASQLVHILSIVWATPELLFVSLLMQAAFEAAKAALEYRQGHLPEMIANIALCLIRSAQAAPHAATLHRNYFGKALTQKAWEKMYWKAFRFNDSNEVDVEALLKKEWISSHIKDINFQYKNLSRFVFQNMRFQKCNFSEALLEKSRMHHISFDSCLFDKALWINALCQDISFKSCSLKDASFIHTQGKNLSFDKSDLSYACFNSSTLDNISIEQSHLQQTSFLFARVRKGSIRKSTLQDVFFTSARPSFSIKDCKHFFSNKPVIALSWNFRSSGALTPTIYEALGANGALALKVEQFPDEIDPILLEQEVRSGLERIEKDLSETMLSRSQELLRQCTPSSQIARMKERAEELSLWIDGISLPGGGDIEPEFYGQQKAPFTYCEQDVRRTVTELTMLDKAMEKRIPTMGTCRGSQLINVFMGGDLHQNVLGHWGGFQKMHWTNSPYIDRFRPFIGEEMHAFSAHHQASNRMGKDLEVIFENGGIPKLFVSRDEIFLGSQVHPELHIELKEELAQIKAKQFPDFIQPLVDYKVGLYKKEIANNQNIYRYFVGKCADRKQNH